MAGNNPTLYGYVGDSNGEVDVFGLAGTPWVPHGAGQPDVIQKGPHFYVGDGKTELKLAVDSKGNPTFENVFSKDIGTAQSAKMIKEAQEKLLKDASWRAKLIKNAGDVKHNLFNTFKRHDRSIEVKKIEKSLKKLDKKIKCK